MGEDDDDLVSLFGETLNRVVEEGAPGVCMIDLFPFRKFSETDKATLP